MSFFLLLYVFTEVTTFKGKKSDFVWVHPGKIRLLIGFKRAALFGMLGLSLSLAVCFLSSQSGVLTEGC